MQLEGGYRKFDLTDEEACILKSFRLEEYYDIRNRMKNKDVNANNDLLKSEETATEAKADTTSKATEAKADTTPATRGIVPATKVQLPADAKIVEVSGKKYYFANNTWYDKTANGDYIIIESPLK